VTVWSFPTKIVFGAGKVATLGDELHALGDARALVVSDAGCERAGLLEPVEAALRKAKIDFSRFTGVQGNPKEADVEAGAAAYLAEGAEAIVAVGGGSSLDVAKLIAVRVRTDRPFEELDDAKGGDKYVPDELPSVIAVPTTAGTGSEVGRAGVVTVESTGRKTVVFAPSMLPRVAILDPEMTVSMPPRITAATGFDALTHCIEAYLSKGDHPMADAIALAGIDLCVAHLARAVEQPKDLEARGAMLKSAMMGAVAFQKGLGACHSLAHPLSSQHGLHHGEANAICLPAVVDFNESAVPERVVVVAQHLHAPTHPEACAEALGRFRHELGLPDGLAAVGIREEHLDALADEAFDDACHQCNPRAATRDDLHELFRASM
jgi:4-hydroxybutyrate dehydrogenase